MEPCYLDLHIHTSENPNCLNKNYDLDKLLLKIADSSLGHYYLISITDHNVINKDVYAKLLSKGVNFLVGAELTIRNYDECDPYHCHLYFNIPKDKLEEKIDELNTILDKLYPEKLPPNTDNTIPNIQTIVSSFDDYDFLVLPHGGQSHSTFDKSIPDSGVRFDTTMMKTIYYNVFDGFTARSNAGLERTQKYFQRLGINEIVNLITCTDNYNPAKYPSDKNDSGNFIKTWMYSQPNFDGLRIALSESSRLTYGDKPIDSYQHIINGAHLHNERIDIDVNLSDGLNVVIGSSSSGKTLFVDSIYRKIKGIDSTSYSDFKVEDMVVDNPLNIVPHYFSQNYILNEILKMVAQNKGEKEIGNVTLLSDVFKFDEREIKSIEGKLEYLVSNVNQLFSSSKSMKEAANKILSIPNIVNLLDVPNVSLNPYSLFAPNHLEKSKLGYSQDNLKRDIEELTDVKQRLSNIPFIESLENEFDSIFNKLKTAQKKNDIEATLRKMILELEKELNESNGELSSKSKKIKDDKRLLLECVTLYSEKYVSFFDTLEKIKTFSLSQSSKSVNSSGHTLSMINKLEITNQVIVNCFAQFFGVQKVKEIDDIEPALFDVDNLLANCKSKGLDYVKEKIIETFKRENRVIYKILYKGTDDFFKLSPGLQASVILDIILGYDGDNAPLIIDQPEDNLSISYINNDLIKRIKESKGKRQIIIVSHNATIPMLGDAQTIVLCNNSDGKISVSSHSLEDSFENRSMTDWIAELTDGGKKSIKKRFKKYNIKSYKE